MNKTPALFLGLFTGLLATLAARADAPDFEDVESRIDYAYFTEDLNALGSLIQTLKGDLEKEQGGAITDPLAHYLLAFAHYRRGLLLSDKSAPKPSDAFSACIEDLDKAIDTGLKSADAYALQSACYGYVGDGRYWQRMMDTSLGGWRMDKALKLGPSNPRVVFIDGLREYEGRKLLGGTDKTGGLGKFRRAIELFESQHYVTPGSPAWGLADAYAWLGRGLMESGDTLGARNAFERALIVAPEFAAARRGLRELIEQSR